MPFFSSAPTHKCLSVTHTHFNSIKPPWKTLKQFAVRTTSQGREWSGLDPTQGFVANSSAT